MLLARVDDVEDDLLLRGQQYDHLLAELGEQQRTIAEQRHQQQQTEAALRQQQQTEAALRDMARELIQKVDGAVAGGAGPQGRVGDL